MVRQIILFLFILILPMMNFADEGELSKETAPVDSLTVNKTIISSEQIDRLPVRDFQSVIANRPGLSIHNNDIHIRGGRENEVGFYINGISATNPVTNRNAVYVIPEAIDYLQIWPGNFNAEMGGYISGIINSELKSGGSKLKGSVDFRIDGFGNPEKGIKWFDTYVYGHQTGVATLSGPLMSDKINFFVAGEYRRRKDNAVRFSKGFEFKNLTDMSVYVDSHEDSINLSYPDGFTPHQEFLGRSVNATITFDLPVKITLNALYQNNRTDVCTAPMLNALNDRIPYNDYTSTLLTSKFTKRLGDQSLLEVQLSYFSSESERGDSWFGHDWKKWYDSTAVRNYTENHYEEPV
ncbi:MAG: TonB-dependent receptor plug domain-containing protein, partial [Fidelibacterota bacterium]